MISFSFVTFITTLQCNILHFLLKRVGKPLARTKIAITLENKGLSNFSGGIERQKEGYQGTNITLIFTRPVAVF